MHAKLLHLHTILCNPTDCSLQAPLSLGFSGQGYWSGLPCPPAGDLPNPGIKHVLLMSPALAGRFFRVLAPPGKSNTYCGSHWNTEFLWFPKEGYDDPTGTSTEFPLWANLILLKWEGIPGSRESYWAILSGSALKFNVLRRLEVKTWGTLFRWLGSPLSARWLEHLHRSKLQNDS